MFRTRRQRAALGITLGLLLFFLVEVFVIGDSWRVVLVSMTVALAITWFCMEFIDWAMAGDKK